MKLEKNATKSYDKTQVRGFSSSKLDFQSLFVGRNGFKKLIKEEILWD